MAYKRSAYLIFLGSLIALVSVINAASAQSTSLQCVRTHVFGSPLLAEKVYIDLFREDNKVLIREGDLKPDEYTTHVETDTNTPKDNGESAVTTCQNVHKTFAKFNAHYVFWGKEETNNRCGSVDDGSKNAVLAKDSFNPYYELDRRTGTLLYFENISKDKFDSKPADEVFGCDLQ